MLRPNQPADAPARGVEILACGTDREGQFGDLWREAANAGKWNVIQAVVDLERISVGKVRGFGGGIGEKLRTSSERIIMLFLTQTSPMACSSSFEKTFPMGL